MRQQEWGRSSAAVGPSGPPGPRRHRPPRPYCGISSRTGGLLQAGASPLGRARMPWFSNRREARPGPT
eukprot:3655554-Lingulodinium_polyedra.AAC.1